MLVTTNTMHLRSILTIVVKRLALLDTCTGAKGSCVVAQATLKQLEATWHKHKQLEISVHYLTATYITALLLNSFLRFCTSQCSAISTIVAGIY